MMMPLPALLLLLLCGPAAYAAPQRWAVANDTNAAPGSTSAPPTSFAVHDIKTPELCLSRCQANASCTVYAWSPNSGNYANIAEFKRAIYPPFSGLKDSATLPSNRDLLLPAGSHLGAGQPESRVTHSEECWHCIPPHKCWAQVCHASSSE